MKRFLIPGIPLLACEATEPPSGDLCVRPEGHTVGPHMADNGARWDDDLFLFLVPEEATSTT